MKNVTKVQIEVTFPHGGHFYSNLNLIVYKQFLKFIHHLSCLSPNSKCKGCALCNECRYYQLTGENFTYYPGIMMGIDLFSKSILEKEENVIFDFYLIGNNQRYIQYVYLFFESFLEQQIVGNFFYLKSITRKEIENTYKTGTYLKVISMIEPSPIDEVYNNMIRYYQQAYDCDFKELEPSTNSEVVFERQIRLQPFISSTRKIQQKGVIGNYRFNQSLKIPTSIVEVGIGKFNFLGGGRIVLVGGETSETEN